MSAQLAPHPFDISRTPAEIYLYLLTLLPAEADPEGAAADFRRRYIIAIAYHYWEKDARPACTVAHVVATLSCTDLETVVRMLYTTPDLMEMVKPIADALELNNQHQLAAIGNELRLPLRRIEVGQPARDTVLAHLKPFSY